MVGVTVLLVNWFGGMIAAKAVPPYNWLLLIEGAVGLAGMLIAGRVGLFLGPSWTVLLVKYPRSGDHMETFRTATYSMLGVSPN